MCFGDISMRSMRWENEIMLSMFTQLRHKFWEQSGIGADLDVI